MSSLPDRPPVVIVEAARWRYWFWTLLILGPATIALVGYSWWTLLVLIPIWVLLYRGPLRSR